jgi:penicillin-binding protein 1A
MPKKLLRQKMKMLQKRFNNLWGKKTHGAIRKGVEIKDFF